jgi:hypothetical protein
MPENTETEDKIPATKIQQDVAQVSDAKAEASDELSEDDLEVVAGGANYKNFNHDPEAVVGGSYYKDLSHDS